MSKKFWNKEEIERFIYLLDNNVSARTNAYHIYQTMKQDYQYKNIDLDQFYNGVLRAKKIMLNRIEEDKQVSEFDIKPFHYSVLIDIYTKIFAKPNRWYFVNELVGMLSDESKQKLSPNDSGQNQVLGSILLKMGFEYKRHNDGRSYFIIPSEIKDYLIQKGVIPNKKYLIEKNDLPIPNRTILKLVNIEDVDWSILKTRRLVIKAKSIDDFINKLKDMKETVYYDSNKMFYHKDGILFACETDADGINKFKNKYKECIT